MPGSKEGKKEGRMDGWMDLGKLEERRENGYAQIDSGMESKYDRLLEGWID